MTDFYIFDIPIYRCTEENYYTDIEQRRSKYLKALLSSVHVPRESAPDAYRRIEEHALTKFGEPWDLNQVVGWLRLYAEASHIGGHLWWLRAHRLSRVMQRKVFFLTTSSNILATYNTPDDDSKTIFLETLAQLENVRREPPLERRYMDLTTFRNVGPFIDWRRLLNAAAKRVRTQGN